MGKKARIRLNSGQVVEVETAQGLQVGDEVNVSPDLVTLRPAAKAASPVNLDLVHRASVFPFVLQKHAWKGQHVVRAGPSTVHWDLRVKTDPVLHWVCDGDPRLKLVAAYSKPREPSPGSHGKPESPEGILETTDGKKLSPFDLKPGKQLSLRPGTAGNPTKNTAAFIETVDDGEAEVLEQQEGYVKIDFRGQNGMEGGWIMRSEDPQSPAGLWSIERSAGPQTKARSAKELSMDDTPLVAELDRAPEAPGEASQPREPGPCSQGQPATESILTVAETKAGRRVQSGWVQKLHDLWGRLNDGLKELSTFLTWADYAEQNVPEVSNPPWPCEPGSSSQGWHLFQTIKASDGKDWLLLWSANAFQDNDKEIFTTQALERYVERMEGQEKKGEFWFWHMPGAKMGDIRWQGMVGRFLLEAGPFDDTPIARTFKELLTQHPDGHPAIAPSGWGTSIGYLYLLPDRLDGVYDWLFKYESSVLPLAVAANRHSPKPQVIGRLPMNDRQRAALLAIGGSELVSQVEELGAQRTKELEAMIAYKSGEDAGPAGTSMGVPAPDSAATSMAVPIAVPTAADNKQADSGLDVSGIADQIRAIAAKLSDPGLQKQLQALADKIGGYAPPQAGEAYPPAGQKAIDPTVDSDDILPGIKSLNGLGMRLRMLAGKVSKVDAAAADALKKIAEALIAGGAAEGYPKPQAEGYYPAPQAGAKAETLAPVASGAEAIPVPAAKAVPAEAVAAPAAADVEPHVLASDLKAVRDETAAVVTQLVKAMQEMQAGLATLAARAKEQDEALSAVKAQAEKAQAEAPFDSPPVGSFAWLTGQKLGVIGKKEAQIKPDDPLATDAPKENLSPAAVTGDPVLDAIISGGKAVNKPASQTPKTPQPFAIPGLPITTP